MIHHIKSHLQDLYILIDIKVVFLNNCRITLLLVVLRTINQIEYRVYSGCSLFFKKAYAYMEVEEACIFVKSFQKITLTFIKSIVY